MPNWVENNLKITGNKEELQKFKEFAKTKNYYFTKNEKENLVLDTEKFIPYPKKFKEMDDRARRYDELKAKDKNKLTTKETKELILIELENNGSVKDGFNSGGYGWCISNWGTKWGICNPELTDDNNDLFYSFDTAWDSCSPIILKMSELFPKLKFNYKYWESGSGFRGILICKKGVAIKDKIYDYKGFNGG